MKTIQLSAAQYDNLHLELRAAAAGADTLYALACTGDLETLRAGSLPAQLHQVLESIHRVDELLRAASLAPAGGAR